MAPLLLLALGGAALAYFAKRSPPLGDAAVTMENPNYIKKYTSEVLRLSALPSPNSPVMLCSYVKVASLDSSSPTESSTQLSGLRQKYESPIEVLYGRRGRMTIVRQILRYFDPQTMKELPGDILFESSDKFQIPTAPSPGVPCG